MTAACPIDGSVRIEVDAGPGYVVWRCPWCQDVTREDYDPVATALHEAMNGGLG